MENLWQENASLFLKTALALILAVVMSYYGMTYLADTTFASQASTATHITACTQTR